MVEFSMKLLPIVIMTIFFVSFIKNASENQRFALFNFVNFIHLKGPGIVIKWPWNAIRWVKLTIGDRGELIGDKLMKLKDIEMPIEPEGKIPIGSFIRIKSFSEQCVFVIADPDQRRKVTCERCGHKMEI